MPKMPNNLKFSADIMLFSGFNPDRAGIYLNKTELNIIDLFKHFRKKRLFLDINDNCQNCGTTIKDVNITKIFYTSPKNLILNISSFNEDKYKLNIDEFINIKDFVERKDISKVNYRLVGAIFKENVGNESKYISITRNIKLNDNSWLYFNGNSIQKCSFNEIINHKKLEILIPKNLGLTTLIMKTMIIIILEKI